MLNSSKSGQFDSYGIAYTTPLESLAKNYELKETPLPHLHCSDT